MDRERTDEYRQCILLVDDDSGVTDALSYALERAGRKIIVCSDVSAAEVALERFPVTHMVSDVQFSGEFGFEGLHFLGRVRAMAPRCRIVLITGYASSSLRKEALTHGASAILAKPFAIPELEAALSADHELSEPTGDDPAAEILRIPALGEILGSDTLTTVFQPIVRLTPAGVSAFGYEALARVRQGWLTGGAAMLFDYASRADRLTEMNHAAIGQAFAASAKLPPESTLFINVDPVAFDTPLPPLLTRAARMAGVPLDRVVLEVTERSAFQDTAAATRLFDELRASGIRFALDDHGSAYSHLSLIDRIRPSFIKISHGFGTAFEDDTTKERIVRHTVALASDFGCDTIIEGIECATTARAAAEAGISLAQGFHFGRPHAASHWTGARAVRQHAA
jgi:EAL domain-containing protein (putative c-di-GMP-specific phosphodiesterase class I)/ActR/RegA family two-component response regulator